MSKKLTIVFVLFAAIAQAQTYDSSGRLMTTAEVTNTSATASPVASRLTDGSTFIVPVLDTTLTARFPVGSTPADNESNAVTITRSGAFMFVFDGSTWDRWTGAVSQSGTWNVGTVTTVTTLTSITNPVAVTGTFWQATQPVSGNVSAFITDGIDTASVTAGNELQVTSSQSGPWNLRLTDIGGDTATILNLTNEDPLAVAIVDGAGSQITSFGGGVQYTEGNTDASITGTAVMWEDTGDALAVASAAKPLPVNVVAGGAGDGKILDGTAAGQADVFDYTNSRPLAVRLTDTAGDYVGAGAGTQYQDGAAQATPTGTVALGHDGTNVRALTTDANGDAQVDVLTSALPTGASTLAEQQTQTTALQLIDDLSLAQGSTTAGQRGPLIQGAVTTAAPTYVSGQTSPISLDLQGATRVNVTSMPGVSISAFPDNEPFNLAQVAGASVQVSNGTATGAIRMTLASDSTGQVTANAGTNLNTSALLTTTAHDAAFGTAGTADAQVRTIQGIAGGTAVPVSGTFWQATQPVSGTFWQATQPVSAASLPLPTGAATSALQDGIIKDGTGDTTQANVSGGRLQVDGSGVTQPVSGTFWQATQPVSIAATVTVAAAGTAAHDGTTLPNPLGLGAFAETPEDSDANTNANRVSADADLVRLAADRNGVLYVRNGPPHRWAYHENSSSALTDTTVHASCGTGLYNYIESITASTGGATAFSIMIEDSTTATILGPYYLEAVAGRGLSVTYPGGRKQTNSATLISVTTTGAVAHGIDITGFCAP